MTTLDRPIYLSKGAHSDRFDADGNFTGCAMEFASWLANEPHTDHPQCVCPVLGAFGRAFNDGLDDDRRQRLRPYLARMVGTAGDGHSEERAWMATDWLVRECAPAFLDLAGLHSDACNLRSLGRVLSEQAASSAVPSIDAAWDAAWAAAWDAARAAAGDAAWAAAGDAAGAAAGDALAPTVDALVESAFTLLDRMIGSEPAPEWAVEREREFVAA